MDQIFNDGVDYIQLYFGIDGTTLLATLAFVSIICRLVGNLIPDDKKGWLGVVRNVCQILGLYASNRLTSGVSVNDVARVVADTPMQTRDPISGKFTPMNVLDRARTTRSHWGASVVALCLVSLVTGCTTLQRRAIGGLACTNLPYLRQLIETRQDTSPEVLRTVRVLEAACPPEFVPVRP